MTREELKSEMLKRTAELSQKITDTGRDMRKYTLSAISILLDYAERPEDDFNEIMNAFDTYDFNTAKGLTLLMDKLKLKDSESLKKWYESVKEYAGYMLSCTQGKASENEISKLIDLKEEAFKYSFKWGKENEFIVKNNIIAVILYFMRCSHYLDLDGAMKNYLDVIPFSSIKYLFKQIVEVLSNVTPEETEQKSQPKSKEPESPAISLMLNDMKSALENEKNKTERYRRELEKARNDSEKNALVRIFRRMNSDDMENILDQFAVSSENLKKLESDGFEIPPELNSCAICVDMFMRALDSLGIKPTRNIGETLTIGFDESGDYDYTGSFFGDDELKTVRVHAPGWTFKGEIISQPKVYECK